MPIQNRQNLFLALTGEVGELSEILQFHGDLKSHISNGELVKLASEMSDVLIYLVRFADSLRLLDDAIVELTKSCKKRKKKASKQQNTETKESPLDGKESG